MEWVSEWELVQTVQYSQWVLVGFGSFVSDSDRGQFGRYSQWASQSLIEMVVDFKTIWAGAVREAKNQFHELEQESATKMGSGASVIVSSQVISNIILIITAVIANITNRRAL